MVIVRSEFILALNQVATERGISPEDVISSLETAMLAAFHKEYPDKSQEEGIYVKMDNQTGETHVFDADDNDITPPGFGRIATQTAKQVVMQKVREAEKKMILSQYKSQVGSLIKGRVLRYDGFNAFVDVGKSEALLPRDEQIRSESYSTNSSYIFYLKEIKEDKFGHSRIILSRSDERLVSELFKREVPEILSGTVEIKKVSREPGERAKIAVNSVQGGVDPVGACVGQKGVRVQMVTDELGGFEKIDIIQWSSDPVIFLRSALSPATILDIEIDESIRKAKVTVDEDQTPLAIGRGGVNVNLASSLVGYEIDIVQKNYSSKNDVGASSEEKDDDKMHDSESSDKTVEKKEGAPDSSSESSFSVEVV